MHVQHRCFSHNTYYDIRFGLLMDQYTIEVIVTFEVRVSVWLGV